MEVRTEKGEVLVHIQILGAVVVFGRPIDGCDRPSEATVNHGWRDVVAFHKNTTKRSLATIESTAA